MNDAQLLMLRGTWNDVDASAREQAWIFVKASLRRGGRERMLDDARDRIGAWVNNYPSPMATGEVPATFSMSGMDPGSIRRAAIPPMLDAIAALIAGDDLSERDHSILFEPIAEFARRSGTL